MNRILPTYSSKFFMIGLCLMLIGIICGTNLVMAQTGDIIIQGQLAYIGPDGNLYIHRSDFSPDLQITSDADESIRYLSPQWSPDGLRLAYCQILPERDGRANLYMLQVGEWLPLLLDDRVYCADRAGGSLSWSLDGTDIFYGRLSDDQAGQNSGIWKVNFIDGAKTPVIDSGNSRPLAFPSLAKNGNWIKYYEVISSEGLGMLNTWQVPEQKNFTWVGMEDEIFPGFSSWSGEGDILLFDEVTFLGFPGASIYRAKNNGSERQRLFQNTDMAAQRPLTSPDGAFIAFQLSIPGRLEGKDVRLMVMDAEGLNQREVIRGGDALTPIAWSPTGAQLFFADYDGQRIIQYIYDMTTGSYTEFGTGGAWDIAWSHEPVIVEEEEESDIQIFEKEDLAENWIAFIAPNYQLRLKSISSTSELEISKPMTTPTFWASPSGRTLLTSKYLLRFDSAAGQGLRVSKIHLPASPWGDEVSWSPNEHQVAYRDRQGQIWLVNDEGAGLTIPGAVTLPSWSTDNNWLMYCDQERQIWYVGGGNSPREAIKGSNCRFYWAAEKPLVAFFGDDTQDTEQVLWVYDLENGNPINIGPVEQFFGWSPAGSWLATELMHPDGSHALVINDPTQDREILVARNRFKAFPEMVWGQSPSQLLLGSYQFDLNGENLHFLGERVLAQADQGQHYLTIQSNQSLSVINCLDLETNLSQPIITIKSESFDDQIQVDISPRGDWVSIVSQQPEWSENALWRCDGQTKIQLNNAEMANQGAFSPDGNWFFHSTSAGLKQQELHLMDLSIQESTVITTLLHSPAVWITGDSASNPERMHISGKVRTTDGKPLAEVALIIGYRTLGYSTADGTFDFSKLTPGVYRVKAEKNGYVFQPQEIVVDSPEAAQELDFVATSEISRDGSSNAQAPEPGSFNLPVQESEDEIAYSLMDYIWLNFVWYAENYGILILTGLGGLLAGVLLIRMRKRKQMRKIAERVLEEKTAEEIDSGTETDWDEESTKASLAEAIMLIRKGEYSRAQPRLRVILDNDPTNGQALIWAGVAAARMNRRKTAEHYFRRAKSLGHPKAGKALEWLGISSEE